MNTPDPLVSIILPTYNRARVISGAVDCVLAQTMTNWELLIVDDGSTDNTEEVLERYTQSDGRIRYFCKHNGGAASARNYGMSMACGKYIAFLDSDDAWALEKLEKQCAVFDADQQCGLVYTGIRFVDTYTKKERIKYAIEKGNIATEEIAYNPIGGPSRVMIKAGCIAECGNFDERFLANEDWDLWIRITAKYPVGVVKDACVIYAEHADSLTYDTKKLIDGYVLLWEKYGILEREAWIRAVQYRMLGHKLCYGGSRHTGRSYFAHAIRVQPFNVKNAVLCVLSFFPTDWYRKITHVFMKYAL